jgi:hypothetical protein
MSNTWLMKTYTKNLIPDFLLNPISRNLLLIFVGTLLMAAIIVTTRIVVSNQL